MGVKNVFKKSKIFDRDGFYVILFICLCIVGVTAVYITNNNSKKNQALNNPTKQTQPINSVDLVDDNPTGKSSIPTAIQPPKTTTETPKTTQNPSTKTTQPAPSTNSVFKLVKPVDGNISRDYCGGNKTTAQLTYSQSMGQWETHEGIDILCDMGTEVKAAADGKVASVLNNDATIYDDKFGYGVAVIIEHSNGMKTVYANLAEDVKVKVGDNVKSGQILGKVGDTSTRESISIEGSHLHFAVLKNSKNVKDDELTSADPKQYFK